MALSDAVLKREGIISGQVSRTKTNDKVIKHIPTTIPDKPIKAGEKGRDGWEERRVGFIKDETSIRYFLYGCKNRTELESPIDE